MKKVTSDSSLITIAHYRNLLQSEGITAFVRNEHFASIMGEIPFQEVWPELWIENDLDLDRAKQLIDAVVLEEESGQEDWICNNCQAENEGMFAACWSCGKPALGSE